MKKILIIIATVFPFLAFAAEQKANVGLRANVKRLALEFSNTSVSNAKEYLGSPIAALRANDELIIKGTFDFALEYEQEKYRWDNKIFAAYGKTTVTAIDGAKTKSENADDISFVSDFSGKFWKYNQADIGAFGNLGYQTEFTATDASTRNKVARTQIGFRLFNGVYFSDVYFANVGELDMTYDKNISKYALEIGATAEKQLYDGVKFKISGYYRNYLAYSTYNANDLEYDLSLKASMDVKITKILSLAPFVNYRMAEARGADDYANNLAIGISITYSDMFKVW